MRRLLFEWTRPLAGLGMSNASAVQSPLAFYTNRISFTHTGLTALRPGTVRNPVHRARDHVPSPISMLPNFNAQLTRKTDMEGRYGFIGNGNHQSAQGI